MCVGVSRAWECWCEEAAVINNTTTIVYPPIEDANSVSGVKGTQIRWWGKKQQYYNGKFSIKGERSEFRILLEQKKKEC